ncbi:MAG: pyridoxamine 5'-phosphate oxidase family protein [Planctomycetes bacterium]|nr:pyridoxamine 5'-phosphate oxidase family protein [Planctomycetota bacterium]
MTKRYQALTFTPAVLEAQRLAYGGDRRPPTVSGPDRLGAAEQSFIRERSAFYMATVSETGWPYLQHRGGERGQLLVLDDATLAFADRPGNRQLLSVGNLQLDGRVALLLMDYPGRRRLKIMGRAEVRERSDPGLSSEFEWPADAERLIVIRVEAFDWNCPKYIEPRYTQAEVDDYVAPLRARIAELEGRSGIR